MGVAGSGKTTLGKLLASSLHIPFFDADEFHPVANIEKMKKEIPLTDEDRVEWLRRINQLAVEESKTKSIVIACSALKETYRQLLMKDLKVARLWFLMEGSYELIFKRINERKEHFMPPALLQSQFDILQIPSYAFSINVELSSQEILALALDHVRQMDVTIGIIGLGVMGRNLARNFGRNGFPLSLYNQRIEPVEVDVAKSAIRRYTELNHARGFEELDAFVESLPRPRIIICMVPAGDPVDRLIDRIQPFLHEGDIFIDGGNSHYRDTERRQSHLLKNEIHFVGAGISGGEEGALNGPSMMFGGSTEAYEKIKFAFERIAAEDRISSPCCALVGKEGAGHFVKMVHNGIEYAEMQLLAEVYGMLRWGHQRNPDEIADLFTDWLKTDANSYLLSVSVEVLRKKEDKGWLIDSIIDKAENKGTGSWTTIAAAELGVPIPTIAESLFARYASFQKQLRVELNETIPMSEQSLDFFPDSLWNAYQLARISNHQQGFQLIETASKRFNWGIDLSVLARIWTNGCIIRSTLMENLIEVLAADTNLLKNDSIQSMINKGMDDAISITSESMKANIPIPAMASAIIYLQTMRKGESYANFIQAQRDYFGAHGYQRIDDPLGKKHHTLWNK